MGVLFSRPSQWLYLTGNCYQLGHTWHPSCVYSASEVLLFVFLESIKVYLPLYLLSNLSRLKDVRWVLLSLIPNVLRSSLFLATNGAGFVAFICLVRRVLGRFYHYSASFLPATLASICAILVERKSRRGMLTGYVFMLALELVFTILKSKGIIKPVPYGEVMIFALASAVHLQRIWSKKGPSDAIGSVLRWLFQPPVSSPVKICMPYKGIAKLLWVGTWCFLCGYAAQLLLSLLSYWKKIKRGTASVKDWLLNGYSIKFGLFLASFSTWFKVSNWLMTAAGVPQDLRLAIAGLVAGLSMMIIRNPPIALYFGVKALETLYFKAVKTGYLRTPPYSDVLLYAVSTGTLFHGVFFESHHVRDAYVKFIERVTRGRISQINYDAMDYFGTNASIRWKQQNTQRQSAQDK